MIVGSAARPDIETYAAMKQRLDAQGFSRSFQQALEDTLTANPPVGVVGLAQSPAVVDVMGGICEDTDSLLLTASLGPTCCAAAWLTDQATGLRISRAGHPSDTCEVAWNTLASSCADTASQAETADPAGGSWAAPAALALHHAIERTLLDRPALGLCVLMETGVPEGVDIGRISAETTAVLRAVSQAVSIEPEPLELASVCAAAAWPLTGLFGLRGPMTALCAPAEPALLQLQFRPRPAFEPFALPAGITIAAVHTRLERPTTRHRLIETRTCVEMSQRMIAELSDADGRPFLRDGQSLSSIAPPAYLRRIRERLPTKMKGQAFAAKYGGLRGLTTPHFDTACTYKVRSRAEHHIYESQRVREFINCLSRARRTGKVDQLAKAGDLMYASHWSHSQRCGIGGIEADRIANAIRDRGPSCGLFGAKVTGGGAGGDLVVMMRDDDEAGAALDKALEVARDANGVPLERFGGYSPGAIHVAIPALEPHFPPQHT